MRFYLLNVKEQVIHAFDADDVPAARAMLRTKCMQDGSGYVLAGAIRRGRLSFSPPPPDFVDDPA